jgi:hypothetical protein
LFWARAFTYLADTLVKSISNLSYTNTHLSALQKELLLWHQRLSHSNVNWIQTLIGDRKWLIDSIDKKSALHTGPFIHSSTQAKTCNTKGLKCTMCLCAKAHSRTPIKRKLDSQHIINEKMLKKEHLLPSSCISVNHYMSSVMGRLPHTFGRERIGYSCGTLFVDHARGKLFIFCQFSNNASETINSKQCLESLARQEGLPLRNTMLTIESLRRMHSRDNVIYSNKNIHLVVSAHIAKMVWQKEI